MGWLSRIFGGSAQKLPAPVARPHQGGGAADAEALYSKLDAMKAERGVPKTINQRDRFDPTKGMAHELLKVATADGTISPAEAAALADIADQRYDHYGNQQPNDLPLIGYAEGMSRIAHVVSAPNAEAGDWWAKVAAQEKPVVTLAMARELGVILLKDKSFTSREDQYAYSVSTENGRNGITFTEDALVFLSFLGKSEGELKTYKEDPLSGLSASQRQVVADTLALTAQFLPERS